jgi:hypothetical protein
VRVTRTLIVLAVLALSATVLGACGDTVQDQPIARSELERLVMSTEFPIYWLGGSFEGLAVTGTSHDPSGAFTLQYGDCTQGGQVTCVTPLQIVTSPDNSFRPGGTTPAAELHLRGLTATSAQSGNAITLATGGVIVDVYASSPKLARAAAQTMVPINRPALPGAPLPRSLPDTGFGAQPLPSQKPPTVSVPRALSSL